MKQPGLPNKSRGQGQAASCGLVLAWHKSACAICRSNRDALLAGVSHDLRSAIPRWRRALELARAQPTRRCPTILERYLAQMDYLIGDFIATAVAAASVCRNRSRWRPGSRSWRASTGPSSAMRRMHAAILDRGPGIPSALLDQVFDPFFRIDPARQTPGSGLGLAVVREICRIHGWRIELSNRVEGGLQALLTLPFDAS